MSERLERRFPNLRTTPYLPTSEATETYNCIAWAAGDDRRWWASWAGGEEELSFAYWPAGVPRQETTDAWAAVFTARGFTPCDHPRPEPGVEKVALYATADGRPTHVARQLPDGRWTSKLGKGVDLTHELAGLEGEAYGAVVRLLRRGPER